MNFNELVGRYRVTKGQDFALDAYDSGDTAGLRIDKGEAKKLLEETRERLTELQDKLYAQDRWSVLLIFQAMDAAGKDSAIKHVMSGVNPQGCQVYSFKAPSAEELDHDFLWRTARAVPERGRIGIFNRSYYEEVLVARVHPEILGRQRLPEHLISPRIWDERLEDIAAFERYLARQGTLLLKFYLNVSKEEQRKRLLARLDDPTKHWKFDPRDVVERGHWADYRRAYEAAIRATAAEHAPWFVVPADRKWFTRLVVASAIDDALDRLGLAYPAVDPQAEAQFEEARRSLMNG